MPSALQRPGLRQSAITQRDPSRSPPVSQASSRRTSPASTAPPAFTATAMSVYSPVPHAGRSAFGTP